MYGALALALAAAEHDVPLIDIDHTLWIQLGIFLLLMIFLSKVVFGPYLKLKDAREKGIEGARSQAKEMQHGADERVADYEARLLQAKQRGAEERARLRADMSPRVGELATAVARKLLGREVQ
jgi:F0F1-type ATP synthase membrane subunit b/b'